MSKRDELGPPKMSSRGTDYFYDDEPVGRCTGCGRQTWDTGMVSQTCYAPRGRQGPCHGFFKALPRAAFARVSTEGEK